jgi:hypothetical protein
MKWPPAAAEGFGRWLWALAGESPKPRAESRLDYEIGLPAGSVGPGTLF